MTIFGRYLLIYNSENSMCRQHFLQVFKQLYASSFYFIYIIYIIVMLLNELEACLNAPLKGANLYKFHDKIHSYLVSNSLFHPTDHQ